MKDVHVASLYDYMHFAGFYVFNVVCFKLNSSNESNMQIYLRQLSNTRTSVSHLTNDCDTAPKFQLTVSGRILQ